ncbi:MAG: CarD family transcriptional regulator [Rickettsiales bacterium]|jgi:CarD family transcriptional regulator|nr:CarD family transcriptional regulator [Rickettsiales bacterium]
MKNKFKVGGYCFYRMHGVARVEEIKTVDIMGEKFDCMILYINDNNMTISVPMSQVDEGYIREISTKDKMEEVFGILMGGVKKMKGMWSRRAKEYEEKINSGDVISIAEVVSDLTRDVNECDRSYSERVIYECALERLTQELAIVDGISPEKAKSKIIEATERKVVFKDIEDIERA